MDEDIKEIERKANEFIALIKDKELKLDANKKIHAGVMLIRNAGMGSIPALYGILSKQLSHQQLLLIACEFIAEKGMTSKKDNRSPNDPAFI